MIYRSFILISHLSPGASRCNRINRFSRHALLAALFCLTSPAISGSGLESVDEIAIFPYLSPQKLVQLYRPLAQNLERSLGHPVRVVSAPDYATFMARLAQQKYMLVINASHMARMAQLDGDYAPILRPMTDLEAVVVVPMNSMVTQLSELRGATVGVPSRIAQITQIAGALMRDAGLEPGTDVTLVNHPTHSSAVMAVIHGLDKAAVVSSRAMDQLRGRVGDRVRVLTDSRSLKGTLPGRAPPIIYQVNSALDAPAREQLTRIISNFANNSNTGQAFINQFGYQGLRPLEPGEMEAMDPFLPELRNQLAEQGT